MMLLTTLENLGRRGGESEVARKVLGLTPGTGVMVIGPDLRVVLVEGAVYGRHGYDVASAVGRDLHDVNPAFAWAELRKHWIAALAGEPRTLNIASIDGQHGYWLRFAPLRTKAGIAGAMMITQASRTASGTPGDESP